MEAASWAGVEFQVVGRDDARFFRAPGLYAFVRDDPAAGRVILFAGQAECLAAEAGPASPHWVEALRLGVNEVHVSFPTPRRVDRLQLLSRIVRHLQPILNVVDEAHPAPDAVRLRA